MKYTVDIKPVAKRYLRKLSTSLQSRITNKLRELESSPRPRGVVKLQGYENTYRIRVGDYRVIYEIHDNILQVLVVKVGPRGGVYES